MGFALPFFCTFGFIFLILGMCCFILIPCGTAKMSFDAYNFGKNIKAKHSNSGTYVLNKDDDSTKRTVKMINIVHFSLFELLAIIGFIGGVTANSLDMQYIGLALMCSSAFIPSLTCLIMALFTKDFGVFDKSYQS